MIDSAAARAVTQPEGRAPAAATTSKGRTAVLLAAGVVAGPALRRRLVGPGPDPARASTSAGTRGARWPTATSAGSRWST